jgi:hypothetical protein
MYVLSGLCVFLGRGGEREREKKRESLIKEGRKIGYH